MVGDVDRGLEARLPGFSSWFGDRLDVELPAFLVSLTIHGILLISLALVGYQVHKEAERDFNSPAVDNLVTAESTFQDLDQSNNPPPPEPAAGSFAPTLRRRSLRHPARRGALQSLRRRPIPRMGSRRNS